ncbi:MAG: hypothetical protein JNM31_14205 [Flavobacteriales bacterium]|nr:hypothetical protein [Flavobacteriales bacterium]
MFEDRLFTVLLVLLPSVVVFLTAFYLIRQFLAQRTGSRRDELLNEMKREDRGRTLPLRLQAYERLTLFLERISPGYLVLRMHKSHMTAGMLHDALTATIREEFEHNVTQQIYVSDRAWQKVRQAKEETIRLVNLAYAQAGEGPTSTDLSQKIFELVGRLSHTPSEEAMAAIKEEVRKLF